MRKSKISNLFDWNKYDEVAAKLLKDPKNTAAIKEMKAEEKKLKVFMATATKDLKVGLAQLRGEVAKTGKPSTIPYFLHLDYFSKNSAGGSLLIFGTSPNLKKEFKAAVKTSEKVNISVGIAQLDANNTLQFIPDTNGMKIKPKPVVDTLKKAPISKSSPGFWSKRKVNNVIIGALSATNTETLSGDETKVDADVSYKEKGVGSEIYDQFKSFVNRDYLHSLGNRNAEYFALALTKTDKWLIELQKELQSKNDPKLKKAYKTMGKAMLLFKKQVEKDRNSDKKQTINEDSSLANFQKFFNLELALFQKENDAYTASIQEGKMQRILLELDQKIAGEVAPKTAIALKNILQKSLSEAVTAKKVDPEIRQKIDSIFEKMQTLVDKFDSLDTPAA